jgi:hypothetical protein
MSYDEEQREKAYEAAKTLGGSHVRAVAIAGAVLNSLKDNTALVDGRLVKLEVWAWWCPASEKVFTINEWCKAGPHQPLYRIVEAP